MIQGELEKELLEALTSCPNVVLACQSVGINPATYYRQCDDDDAFREKATRARTKRAIKALEGLYEAGKTDWRAHQAYLQMAHPEHFSRQRLEISGPGGGPIGTVTAEVSPEFFADAFGRLRQAEAESAPASPDEPVHPGEALPG